MRVKKLKIKNMLRIFEGYADFKTCKFVRLHQNTQKVYENKNILRTSLGLKSKKLKTGFKKKIRTSLVILWILYSLYCYCNSYLTHARFFFTTKDFKCWYDSL